MATSSAIARLGAVATCALVGHGLDKAGNGEAHGLGAAVGGYAGVIGVGALVLSGRGANAAVLVQQAKATVTSHLTSVPGFAKIGEGVAEAASAAKNVIGRQESLLPPPGPNPLHIRTP